MSGTASFLIGTGVVFLLHAAYSSLHYRSLLVVDETVVLPMDILLEVGIGFLLLLGGQLIKTGSLVAVVTTTSSSGGKNNSKSVVQLMAPSYRSRDFDIYSNRANAIMMATTK